MPKENKLQQSLVNSLGQGCVEVEAADGGATVPGPQPKC